MAKRTAAGSRRPWPRAPLPPLAPGEVRLLAGGNPQIPKGDGEGPVQAYWAALPGWKGDVGRRLDALVAAAAPHARRAVRWNSPFYGTDEFGWFLSFHALTKALKATFFNGAGLTPPPPGGTPRSGEARWLDVREHEPLDETLFTEWVRQAAARPGWKP